MNYINYLKSTHWKNTRTEFFKKKRQRCVICHSYNNINLHHTNYNNLGMEKERDLRCLCRNCHSKIHKFGLEKWIGHHKKLRRWFK